MADDQNPIVEILVKYALYEPLSEEETVLLEAWRQRSEGHDALPDQLRDPEWIAEHRRLLKNTPAPIVTIPTPYRIGWRKPALAVVFVLLIVGGWMLLRRSSDEPLARRGAPADFRALLTREDGSMLVLDTVAVGSVIDGSARKTDSNTLMYMEGSGSLRQRLVVARGAGPWRILLADGSRVVVNSGSSLEYSADLRSSRPMLDGEAWFGIARDASRPLTMSVGETEVSVLGTEFAATASSGETRVMLYSGAVRVRKGGDSLVLRPGQAAVVGATGLAVRVLSDSERSLAWRGRYAEEEFFDFENSSLPAMLKELAGWYGVQVSNPESLQGVPLTGKLPRSLPLNEMLRALERVEKGHVRLLFHADTIHVQPGKPGG